MELLPDISFPPVRNYKLIEAVLRCLYGKGSSDGIGLISDRFKTVAATGESRQINGRIVHSQEIVPSAGTTPRVNQFEIEHITLEITGKILFLAGNVPGQKLYLLLLVANHIG